MGKNTDNPVDIIASMLATMTRRVIEAEHERDDAIRRADDWFKNWKLSSTRCTEVEHDLAEALDRMAAMEKMMDLERMADMEDNPARAAERGGADAQ